MRSDSLARSLIWRRSPWPVSPDPADILYRAGEPAVPGAEVARAFGLLACYMTLDRLQEFLQAGTVGRAYGCWLTPTAYAACLAPYNLGVNSPADACVLLDVSEVTELWGPGTSRPSGTFPGIWRGGAVEFFSPRPIDSGFIRDVCEILPCGDSHQ